MSQDPWREGTLRLPELPPLGLYIHLPWCLRKCPYCDFNSHEHHSVSSAPGRTPGADEGWVALQQRYLAALQADLEAALPLVWGRRVSSIFIGGGTPSLFSPEAIDSLLGHIRAVLMLEPDAEVTLEANPGTFETQRFRAFAQAGVTRLSLGVQSFDDASLRNLGRVHDRAQAIRALEEAAVAYATFNIDLMYALPGQDLKGLQEDLRCALSFAPPHLSLYHLTIEPNTAFSRQPPTGLPDEDLAAQMLDAIVQETGNAGLQRYEVSAFAKSGHRCRHNLNYWRFGDYLGIGAGAHSKISFAHRVLRQVRWRDPATYQQQALAGQAVSNEHEVARADLPFEYVLNALRLPEGFAVQHFCDRTGLAPSAIGQAVTRARSMGLLEPPREGVSAQGDRVVPSSRGFDLLSDLQSLFLPDSRKTSLRPG